MFLFLVTIFVIYSLRTFNYNHPLYIRSPEFIHFGTERLYLWPTSLYDTHHPDLGNGHSIVRLQLWLSGFMCKWNHTVFVCFCLTYFIWHNAFQIHLYCCKCWSCILFHSWLYIPLCASVSGVVNVLDIVNFAVMNMRVWVFWFWERDFISFSVSVCMSVYLCINEIAKSYDGSILNFFRSLNFFLIKGQ